MTRSTRLLLHKCLRDTVIFALKGAAFVVSIAILTFVAFSILAAR